MGFLYFWIISIIICYGIAVIYAKAMINSCIRDGYKFKKVKASFSEKIVNFLQYCIPIINIIYILILLMTPQNIIQTEFIKKIKEKNYIEKYPEESK